MNCPTCNSNSRFNQKDILVPSADDDTKWEKKICDNPWHFQAPPRPQHDTSDSPAPQYGRVDF